MNECPSCGQAGMRDRTHACLPPSLRPSPPARYQTCPKCNGQGLVSTPSWVPGDQLVFYATGTGPYTCPVCHGQRVIRAPE